MLELKMFVEAQFLSRLLLHQGLSGMRQVDRAFSTGLNPSGQLRWDIVTF